MYIKCVGSVLPLEGTVLSLRKYEMFLPPAPRGDTGPQFQLFLVKHINDYGITILM